MGLNAKQKEAVEYLDGPLLVLAGPGTGKTQLLSEKVAYILKNTDTSPENILCMTFTETGAANMRERLKTIVGKEGAKVNISTYHAFGSEILAQYKNYSEDYDRRLDVAIDEVTQFKIVKEIQDSLNGRDILRGDAVKDIISAIEVYYPYEWRIIVERYKEYSQADKKLQKFGKRPRYRMPTPEHLLFGLKVTKHLLSPEHMEWHRSNYFCDERVRNVEQFISIRKKKVSKRDDRIKKALKRTQRMEPEFLERLMGLYDRKNVSQKDKVYIIKELEKYYCPKVVNFFNENSAKKFH